MRYATNILAICVAGLLALGIVMLYSAGMAQSGARFLSMQLVWGGLGLMACFAATVMDYRWFKKIAFPLFIFTLFCWCSCSSRESVSSSMEPDVGLTWGR